MDSCWAASIGGCSTKRSREHYVSAALWKGNEIEVVGFPWCRDKPKKVGLGSLTAHILCETHNNELSSLDAAAGVAFDALRRASALAHSRDSHPNKRYERVRFGADGPLLERWFLKTALNLGALQSSESCWYADKTTLAHPGPQLVNLAFGNAPVENPLGLYAAASPGDSIESMDRLEACPLFYFDQGVIGFVFKFRGFSFLLWLASPGPPSELTIPWDRSKKMSTQGLHRHLGYIRWTRGTKTSHYVQFAWPGHKAPNWIYTT